MVTAEELGLVEDALRKAVASNVGVLSKASEHIVCSGGKRLRPRVVLLAYKASGGKDISRVLPLAVAAELVHTASLIHDDINDQSEMRRGQASVNAQWGSGLALLVGDSVFVKLLDQIANYDSRVIRVLAGCCSAIVEGETLQMLHLGDTKMAEETYLAIVAQKTGALFSACGELGGLLAEGTEEQVSALRDYGLNVGIAFQIRDDTLDLVGRSEEMGKPVASDLRQGKMSLASLFTLAKTNGDERDSFFNEPGQAARLLQSTGAVEYAMLRASRYCEEAKRALAVLPGSEARSALSEMADFALARGI
jgi:geranylgeranyl pyrophosphate synthase